MYNIEKFLYYLSRYGIKEAFFSIYRFLKRPILLKREHKFWEVFLKNKKTLQIDIKFSEFNIFLNPYDKGISVELFIHGSHEETSSQIYKRLLKEDDVIIDIGANIGYYVLIAASRLKSGKIIALEPDPNNLKFLKRNIESNQLNHLVNVVNKGLADREGKVKFYISARGNWSSLIPVEKEEIRETVEIEVLTLDKLVDDLKLEKVDFIRMDIEGYEFHAINGMLSVLDKYSPKMFIEIHPRHTELSRVSHFFDILSEKGYFIRYAVNKIIEEKIYTEKMPTVIPVKENINLSDFFASPEIKRFREYFILFLEKK